MAVKDFVRALVRERLLFVCTFVVLVAAGAAVALSRSDEYSATARLLVNTSSFDSATAETTARTFAELLRTSKPASDAADAAAGSGGTANVSVEVAPGTHLVEATATEPSSEQARAIADAYVDAFLKDWRETVQRSGEQRLSALSSEITAAGGTSGEDATPNVQTQSLEDGYKEAQRVLAERLDSIDLAQHASLPTAADGPSTAAIGMLAVLFALFCAGLAALGRNALRD